MKLIVRTHKVERDGRLIEHIQHRVGFAFSRSKKVIKSLAVTLSDINGPKGGVDKACTVVVKTDSLPLIVIKEKQSQLLVAIDRAITRASHSLMQRLKRRRQDRIRAQTIRRLPSLENDLEPV